MNGYLPWVGQGPAPRSSAGELWVAWLAAIVATLSIPVCWLLGVLFIMGTDACMGDQSSGAFKCSPLGEKTIFLLPLGLSIAGTVIGFVGVAVRSIRLGASALAVVLPVVGLIGSFMIAAQDVDTPPDRSVVERAERELSGRPELAVQDTQYLAMLGEIRTAIVTQLPDASGWADRLPRRQGCSSGPPPLDTVKRAYAATYMIAGGRSRTPHGRRCAPPSCRWRRATASGRSRTIRKGREEPTFASRAPTTRRSR